MEAKLAEDNLATQARINDLKAKLAAVNAISEKAIQDHSDIQKKLSYVKIKAKLELKALNVRLSHLVDKAGAQYTRVEDLLKSNLDVRAKFCWTKERLRRYKEKAHSFYRQLTFASWVRDLGISAGYLRGIETFQAWVRKLENFSMVETILVEELLPLKEIAEDM